MAKADRIEQLARELCFSSLTVNQREAKKSELAYLLYNKMYNRNFDTIHFTEAFNSSLAKYGATCEDAGEPILFEKLFWACYCIKNMGSKAEKFQEDNFELSRYRSDQCRDLFMENGLFLNRSYILYPNKEKIIASLREQVEDDVVYEELRQKVEDIFAWYGLASVDAILENEEGETVLRDVYDDFSKEEDKEDSQKLLADIIRMSYGLTKQTRTLYPLDRCWWTGNMYTLYLRMIPLILQKLAEKAYIDYYEQRRLVQKLLDILEVEVFAGYLNYQTDTIRKNIKKLEAFHIQALERVTKRHGISQ
ncbi:MAG: hypothetical protein Q4E64_10280 [Phascolarctobacterium sp.]|uniref:hypothetical protein n=1 Tax=Phascolarctobacterium sp. TaxID=2049039 RepID=UPI0026DCC0AE|nr:hypothetical protein [Phascolarctobacterium sp.]MDO4922194.1 hypothetical protein [Phascolarctobacterium sp.]